MIDLLMRIPKELLEIERVLEELLQDKSHPLHNRSHPYHQDSVLAFNELMAQVDAIRNNQI